MFKFKGISSKDMQVVIEEEEHFIARAAQRYEITEIDGKDGAIYNELGYSVVERPIYVQCLNINKIDDILAWLDGEGEFEYKGRKTIARFYSELDPLRSSCIRIIDTTFIRDPFWYKANEEFSLVKDRKDKIISGTTIDINDSAEAKITELNIKGNSRQKTRSGKNLLELQEGTYTNSGITVVVKDGIITLNGTATEIVPIYINLKTPITALANILYTLSTNNEKTIGDSNNFCALRLNNDGQKQALLHNKNATYLQGNTTDIEITYITIRIASGTTFSNFIIKPQLELGNVASEWEQGGIAPSPDYPSEVETVKTNITETINNKNLARIIGFGAISQTDGITILSNDDIKYSDYIKVIPNKEYTFSSTNTSMAIRIFKYDECKNYIGTETLSGRNSCYEVPNTTHYIRFQLSQVFLNANFQLEKGLESTNYIEHQSQNYEILVQEEMLEGDMFNWDSEQEVHTWDKYIITGNENWKKHTSTNNNSFYLEASAIITNILTPTNNDEKGIIKNTHFKIYNVNNIVFNNIIGTGLAVGTVFYISTGLEGISTVSEFKQWLKTQYEAGTPVTIYYKLAQEKRIPFTEEQKEIAKQIINNAKTYDKVTHIYSTDKISSYKEVTYFTPTNEKINNEGNIQSRPILRLEKTVSEVVELTINDIRFKYNFKDDSYVEIDCEEKTVEYEGLKRNRQIIIGYKYPKLNIGSNKIVMHEGDCIIKILRKDRWL